MAGVMRGLFEDLQWRGLVHQLTDAETLPRLLDEDVLVAYIGFDPTADSLHIGHLLQLCLLRRIQEAGHRPIALVGGGTGMVGDPSGRSDERSLLTPEQLEVNKAGMCAQLERFLDFGAGPNPAILADNADWLAETRLLDFLRDVGKLFTVNEMVRKEAVRARLEEREHGISFTEFSYMLLQAWDFLQLFDRYECRLQLGGSDQWGNITEGVDLIRRRRNAEAFGLTSPLVTKADGTKFGKTESGNVWLDPARTSHYQFFQYWIRTSDAEVGSYLRTFTFLDRPAILELDRATASHPERREAQRILAREVTALVHGADAAAQAERAAAVLFTEAVTELDEAALDIGLAGAPSTAVRAGDLDRGLSVVDALVMTGLASSKGEARRALQGGGVYVNNVRVPVDRSLSASDLLPGGRILLRRGRAEHHVLVVKK